MPRSGNRYAVGVALALGVAALGLVLSFPQGEEKANVTAPQFAAMQHEMDALRSEIRSLRKVKRFASQDGDPGQLEGSRVALAASSRPNAPALEDEREGESEHEEGDTLPAPKKKRRSHAENVEMLQARFAAEPIDAGWAQLAAREIREVLAANTSGARVVGADCASNLCRVVVSHDSRQAQHDLALAIGGVGPFKNGVYYSYDTESNPVQTTLFVVREGRSFRQIQEAEAPLGASRD